MCNSFLKKGEQFEFIKSIQIITVKRNKCLTLINK